MKNMFKFSLIAMLALSIMTPAVAQTTVQVPADQISIPSDYRNTVENPNDFTRSSTGTRSEKNPDITTTTTFNESEDTRDTSIAPNNYGGGHWNARCKTFETVNADCTAQSISPNGGGATRVVTTVTPGGETIINTCTTDSISFGGYDHTSGLFTITSGSSTRDC